MALPPLTFTDIVNDKKLTEAELTRDLDNLLRYTAEKNERKFCGNPFLYHYQTANLCKVRIKGAPSLYDKMHDAEMLAKLYRQAEKLNRTGTPANRLFEANRFNNAVVFFKPTTAKWLYKKFGATKVLDPTAGWGGRMLGAWALGIDYTGIDTNVNMMEAYDQMIDRLPGNSSNLTMMYGSCMDVDFSEIEYDFVLTSPPYVNLELYENMSAFQSDEAFYKRFLMPLLDKCLAHIKTGGYVCFNISPKMYADLLKWGYRAADMTEDLLQQKRLGTDKQDKIYCWRR